MNFLKFIFLFLALEGILEILLSSGFQNFFDQDP